MRPDMARVIVERPRIADPNPRKGRAVALDDLPKQQGIRRPYVPNGKALNENLAPLRRYLDKQVGRPWNKVYSEISARLRASSAVQQHVRDHLHDFVAVKPRRLAGQMRQRPGSDIWFQPYYVDRRTGLLCRTARLRR